MELVSHRFFAASSALVAVLALAGCDGSGAGGSPDASTDTGTDMCADYPEPDNGFGLGDVVRNYTLWDADDQELQLCALAGGDHTLLFLSISKTDCSICAEEVGELEALQAEYADEGVVVMEVLQDADGAEVLEAWPGHGLDYLLLRTSPPDQIVTDYGDGFLGYPTIPLIDLHTMQVLDRDCWFGPSWEECIEEHL